jgi:hypothetical protein
VAKGQFGDPSDPTSLTIEGILGSFCYSGLVRYSTVIPPEGGDSGSLIAAIISSGAADTTIAPVAIHIGVDEDGVPVCYLLDSIFASGWEVAYDS